MISTRKSNRPYCKKSTDVLRGLFPAHLISLRSDIKWPARSPDLLPRDYFLKGQSKAEVYKYRPTTIDGLKAATRKTVNKISRSDSRSDEKFFKSFTAV